MIARLLAVAALAGCASGARATGSHTTTAPTAADIVAKMEATYAHARTFSDHGSARNPASTLGFASTFVRGARFALDIRDESHPEHGFVLWADPTHTYSRWYAPPHTTDDGPGLTVAIAVAARPSAGNAVMLANLLDPKAIPRKPLTGLAISGSEPVDDHPCWVITGKRDDTGGAIETTLWIDRESYLLRKSIEDSDNVSYSPVIDQAIDVAQVTPPDFSDDYAQGSSMDATVKKLINSKAPDFDAALVVPNQAKPGRITLASLAGHVAVIDFWATWCGPCRMTMPRLNEWKAKFGVRGLEIVGLSSEDETDIAKMIGDAHLGYTIARDESAKAARAYNAVALPMLVVVDKTGVVRYVNLGAGNLDAVEAVIDQLLK